MSSKMKFSYFYGNESEMLTFYRIPKLLITDEYFRDLSTDAKVLYGLMLDRMSLSAKNGWFDKEKRVFIFFSVEDTMQYLNCSKNKALKIIGELDDKTGIGLIHREIRGLGMPTIIYVMNFMIADENTESRVQKMNFRETTDSTSGSPKIEPPEVQKLNPNKNKYNNTEYENNRISIRSIVSDQTSEPSVTHGYAAEQELTPVSDITGYRAVIRDQIGYGYLLQSHPLEAETIDGIVEIILEVMLSRRPKLHVAGESYPVNFVQERLQMLTIDHIEYVLECLKKSTSKVRNIKSYLLTTLFNAPATISSYYQAEVNYDLPQFAKH